MSLSKDLHDKIVEVLQDLPEFREVIAGIVPNPSQVKKFPSIAVDFAVVQRKEGITINTMDSQEEVDIYIFNQQKVNKYDDILSDLIKVVDEALQSDSYLKDNCISNYVKEVVTDGGVIGGGKSIARLTLYLKYIERCFH